MARPTPHPATEAGVIPRAIKQVFDALESNDVSACGHVVPAVAGARCACWGAGCRLCRRVQPSAGTQPLPRRALAAPYAPLSRHTPLTPCLPPPADHGQQREGVLPGALQRGADRPAQREWAPATAGHACRQRVIPAADRVCCAAWTDPARAPGPAPHRMRSLQVADDKDKRLRLLEDRSGVVVQGLEEMVVKNATGGWPDGRQQGSPQHGWGALQGAECAQLLGCREQVASMGATAAALSRAQRRGAPAGACGQVVALGRACLTCTTTCAPAPLPQRSTRSWTAAPASGAPRRRCSTSAPAAATGVGLAAGGVGPPSRMWGCGTGSTRSSRSAV